MLIRETDVDSVTSKKIMTMQLAGPVFGDAMARDPPADALSLAVEDRATGMHGTHEGLLCVVRRIALNYFPSYAPHPERHELLINQTRS
jgi:hypothetical protein